MARTPLPMRARRAALGPTGRTVASCSGALAIGVLPLFLVGALSTTIGDELGFGPAGTGAALATFFVASGVTAVPVGWITDRMGAPRAMRTGALLSGAATLAIGLTASSLVEVAIALGVAGVAVGFVDTGASAWFADAVPASRHGLAFGLKEASVPTASLLAGLSLPLLASQFDWRIVFIVAAALSPLVWFLVPTDAAEPAAVSPDDSAPVPWRPLVVFAAGLALGTAAATAASTFLVPAVEDRGWSSSAAGLLLAVASVGSIAFRIVAGRYSDLRPAAVWPSIALTMAAGAAGAALLWSGTAGPLAVVGAGAVLGLGWGWTGLAFHAVLVTTADRPALGAGLVLGGLSLGGAGGPAAFGAISSSAGYQAAWGWASGAMLVGALCTEASRRMLGSTAVLETSDGECSAARAAR